MRLPFEGRRLSPPRFAIALAIVVAPAAVGAACPADKPQVLLERFISADCAQCWRATPPDPAPGKRAFALDWIVPAPPGMEAPMAVAALLEAAMRASREGRLDADEALTRSHPLPQPSALRVTIADGPAWNGYIALQLNVRYGAARPLPKPLSAWVALVERIDAGSDDTPVDRLLVRSLVGPLPLDGLAQRNAVEHLRAVRLPDSGRPERLLAVGWVVAGNGRVIALGRSATTDCPLK